MRRRSWTAVALVLGVAGTAACEGGGRTAQEQPPAEAPPAEAPTTQAPPAAQPSGPLPQGVTPEMVARGEQIFKGQGNCHTCHTPQATGGPLAPNLTDDQWLWLKPDEGDMLGQAMNLIRTGVPQPKEHPAPMPPMGGAQLSDDQIRDVAAYVISLSQRG
ncbi:MAG TPA: cytochrome c [Longimicrobiales bacterium]